MSEIANFPRVPVYPGDWEEGHRRSSDGVNFLIEQAADLDDRIINLNTRVDGLETRVNDLELQVGAIQRVEDERVLARTPTTIDQLPGVIRDYQDIDQPTDSTVIFDPATGVVTFSVPGLYEILGFVNMAGSGNNNWYGLSLLLNGGEILIGGLVWTNQWEGGAMGGAFQYRASAGDTLALAFSTLSTSPPAIQLCQFSVAMRDL